MNEQEPEDKGNKEEEQNMSASNDDDYNNIEFLAATLIEALLIKTVGRRQNAFASVLAVNLVRVGDVVLVDELLVPTGDCLHGRHLNTEHVGDVNEGGHTLFSLMWNAVNAISIEKLDCV